MPLREYLQHILDEADYDIVWDVVKTKIPALAARIRQLLEEQE